MPSQQQIETLIRHAQSQEQQAQACWLKICKQVNAARSQLAELQRYAQDYGVATLQGQLQARALLNHQLFTDRLSEAIVQQSQAVSKVREQEQKAKELWQQQRCHLQALELMQERREAQRAQVGQRREQHRLDEISSVISRGEGRAHHA